jgi:hypothetical protein
VTHRDPFSLAHRLSELRQEHRDLDQAIILLGQDPAANEMQIRRMKKRKLKLKDWINRLESEMIPDLDA